MQARTLALQSLLSQFKCLPSVVLLTPSLALLANR